MKHQVSTIKQRGALRRPGFALYEVLLGVAIFAVGVLALGRAVENCMNASMLNAEEDAVRQILSNRMAEIQTARGAPDSAKEDKVDSGYGMVKLLQKSASAELTEPDNTQLNADAGGWMERVSAGVENVSFGSAVLLYSRSRLRWRSLR